MAMEGKDNNKHGEMTEAKGQKAMLYKKRKAKTYLIGTINVGCKKREALSVSHRTMVFVYSLEGHQEKRKRKKREKRKARRKEKHRRKKRKEENPRNDREGGRERVELKTVIGFQW